MGEPPAPRADGGDAPDSGSAAYASATKQIDLAEERSFTLGGIEVDPSARQVTIAGRTGTLEPRVMQVLVALARRRGKVVSRDALVATCWDHRAVGDDAINRSIAKVRRLGDSSQAFRLETIARVGYKLLELAPSAASEDSPAAGRAALAPAWRAMLAAIVCVLLVGLGMAVYRAIRAPPEVATPEVVVLPLSSLDANPESRAFAESISTSIADAISNSGMSVASRMQDVRLANVAPAALARSVHAPYVVYGETRRQGNRVRVSVRLDDSRFGVTLLSKVFEGESSGTGGFVDRVAGAVAHSVTWTRPLLALSAKESADPQRATLFLRTEALIEEGQGLQAYQDARGPAAAAPDSPSAQLSLAFSAGMALDELPPQDRPSALATARTARGRVLELAPKFGDAYALYCLLEPSILLAACEGQLRRGIAIDPDAPSLRVWLSGVMINVGRTREAGLLADAAFAKDRYSWLGTAQRLYTSEALGDAREAQVMLAHARLNWPDDPRIKWSWFQAVVARGAMAEAFPRLSAPPANSVTESDIIRSVAWADQTRRPADIAAARRACMHSAGDEGTALVCLDGLTLAGDVDGAFEIADKLYFDMRGYDPADREARWLSRGNGAPTGWVLGAATSRLRMDSRFIALARRTGLLAYWRAGRPPDFCSTEAAPVCSLLGGKRRSS
jgi:DNA-binding winged helix-turn-helix (wHTH) protein/TolB-like protein